MTDLTGLELRKAAFEALRWTAIEDVTFISGLRLGAKGVHPSAVFVDEDSYDYLPAIESDPAVSEPLFLEWCEKNDFCFKLECKRLGSFNLAIKQYFKEAPFDWNVFVCEVYGSTPSEARARAIVEASHVRIG